MGEVKGTYARQNEMHTGLGGGGEEPEGKRDHLDTLDGGGKIILKWIFKKRMEGHGLDCSSSR
jgi:hypothetical protein